MSDNTVLQQSLFPEEEIIKELTPINVDSDISIEKRTMDATSNLGLNAQRLLRTLISLIDPQDEEKTIFTFRVSSFEHAFGLSSSRKQLLEAGKILARPFIIADPKNPQSDGVVTSLLSKLTIKQGIVVCVLNKEVVSLYRTLREHTYALSNTLTFICPYSFPFYELFVLSLGNQNSASIYRSLPELHQWLKLGDKYVKPDGSIDFSGMHRRILTPLLKDINGSQPNSDYHPCNISVSLEETKIRKKVLGITFHIVRVKPSKIIKVENYFYQSLTHKARQLYDTLLSLDVDAAVIEESIITHGETVFIESAEYALSKPRNRLYIMSCIKNAWTSNTISPNAPISFANIQGYTLMKNIYDKYELFLRETEADVQAHILRCIVRTYAEPQPQIYAYARNKTPAEILANKDFMVFILSSLADIIAKNSVPDISAEYKRWLADYENRPSADIPEGRGDIIRLLAEHSITSPAMLRKLLEFSDDHIRHNIDYCHKKYQEKCKAGLIIKAISEDYAGYKALQQMNAEKEAMLRRQQELENFLENRNSYSDIQLKNIADSSENPQLKAEADKEIARREEENARRQLQEYFFTLPDLDKAEVIFMAKTANPIASNLFKGKTYAELWANPSLSSLLITATKQFQKENG